MNVLRLRVYESQRLSSRVADQPDDDLPRLVYADWLDEWGDRARGKVCSKLVGAKWAGVGYVRGSGPNS
ncbi:TIGR02996 domain-containing protein [Fimbriiglobus ruber]|uniref:TIGR02996 domain-containing protein n=1 Tax=Fimbriiglobus ruber TaxID=1908690 RepID=UPI003B84A8B9